MAYINDEESYNQRIEEAARRKELLEEEERQRQQREAREKFESIQKNFPPNTILALSDYLQKQAKEKSAERRAEQQHTEKMSVFRSISSYSKMIAGQNAKSGDTKTSKPATPERTIA